MKDREPADYDIISNPERRLAHEGDFLLWLLELAPGRRVLDMAAATGVHAQFLAAHGADLTARDIDEDAIRYARANRASERIVYEVRDLRKPAGGSFDLVILMGNTLSLLDCEDDVPRAFEAAYGQLSPGGVFFVHIVNYAALEAGGPRHKVARDESQGVVRIIVKSMVPLGGGGPALVSFSRFRRKDGVWETGGDQSVLLNLGRAFLEEAAAVAGFEIQGVYGDYDRSPFDRASSPDLLFVLRKGGG